MYYDFAGNTRPYGGFLRRRIHRKNITCPSIIYDTSAQGLFKLFLALSEVASIKYWAIVGQPLNEA